VLEVLEQTKFRPHSVARSLASGRSGVVGVVMHLTPHLLFHDPYFASLLQGITDALAEQAIGVMLWLGSRSKEETLDQILWMRLLDGVIVTADQVEDPLVDGLLASELPTVLIGHRRADLNASYVDIDNVAAADLVTTHLSDLGRRRIAHITGRRGTVAAEDRIAGYRQAMARAGLSIEDLVVEGEFTRASGRDAALELVGRGVDAIFCANDATAEGALETLRIKGLSVPEEVALAGFDDLEFAAHLDPPLTTVRQSVHEQGSQAALSLLHLLQHRDGGPQRVILPTELIIRASTVGRGEGRSTPVWPRTSTSRSPPNGGLPPNDTDGGEWTRTGERGKST
jgi:DNA-binding LacI/PurR family transcriptional regulator